MSEKTFFIWKKEIDQFIINLTGNKLNSEINDFNLKDYFDLGIESNIMAFLIVSKDQNNYKLYDNFEIWNYDYNKYINHLNYFDKKIIDSTIMNNRILYKKYRDPLKKCLEDLNKNIFNNLSLHNNNESSPNNESSSNYNI